MYNRFKTIAENNKKICEKNDSKKRCYLGNSFNMNCLEERQKPNTSKYMINTELF